MTEVVRTPAVFAVAVAVSAGVFAASTRLVGASSFGDGFIAGAAMTAVLATVLVSAGRAQR
jgi:hypothetical protein